MPAGQKYADKIILRLRKVELFVIEQMGIERMQRLNDDMALFLKLFRQSGGQQEK